jgi:cadmium resistance protein CadD (predicted permease)
MDLLLTSILLFTSTNIDDLLVLTLFYGNKKFGNLEIISGQLLGMSCLIALSLLGALVGVLIAPAYIGLLGLVPLFLGLRALWAIFHPSTEGEEHPEASLPQGANILSVAGVTIANGGDNIGIYLPTFTALSWWAIGLMIGVFLLMTLLWCMLAQYFTRHPSVAKVVEKYGHLLTPPVLMVLGLYVLYEHGSLGFWF